MDEENKTDICNITFHKTGEYIRLCLIDSLPDDLKNLIRKNISPICKGEFLSGIKGDSKDYYKSTLKELVERLASKTPDQQKGMIGEFLVHLLFPHEFCNMQHASPFFNMEEASVRKGFDHIFYDKEEGKIWLSEIKSGTPQGDSVEQKNEQLLNSAKRDIYSKLENSKTTLWHNAACSVQIAVKSDNLKEEIIQILNSTEEKNTDPNIILGSVVYNCLSVPIELNDVTTIHKQFLNTPEVTGELIVFSIQKEAYEDIIEFFKCEVGS